MKLVLSVILCLFMTGCSALPTPLEMGDMVFIRTLGVDGEGDSLQLTASTGRRARGLQREEEPSLVLTGEANSISGGMVALGADSDQQVFCGYLDQLILGEGYCQRGIRPILEYFARDVELGLGSEVWVVTGTAEMAVDSGGDQGVDSQLTTLQLEGELGTAGLTRTAGQALTDILEQGATYLPRLIPTEDTLLSAGYTIIIGDVWAGTLTGEVARGLELLEGQPSGDIFVGEDGIVLDIWEAKCQYIPLFNGEQLVGAEVVVSITANLAEYDLQPTQAELNVIRDQLTEREQLRISLAMEELQRLGADAIGLGRQLGMASPSHWAAIEEMWEEGFATLSISVAVDVTIERS